MQLDFGNGKKPPLFPTMKSVLEACIHLNYVKNSDLVLFNDVKTLNGTCMNTRISSYSLDSQIRPETHMDSK